MESDTGSIFLICKLAGTSSLFALKKDCGKAADENAPTPEAKFDSHHNHKRKVAFESILAFSIASDPDIFLPTLHKIGGLVKTFLEKHKPKVSRAL